MKFKRNFKCEDVFFIFVTGTCPFSTQLTELTHSYIVNMVSNMIFSLFWIQRDVDTLKGYSYLKC